VGTRILKPIQAVAMAALANFIGSFVFGIAVARIDRSYTGYFLGVFAIR